MGSFESFDRDDSSFVQDLFDSQAVVLEAAKWLLNKGYKVTVNPTRVRPSVEKMAEYADNGDLEINERIEVKGRKIDFTSREDFPYTSIIVDVAHVWDRAKPKPAFYLLFNRARTHIAVVGRSTREAWVKVEKMDKGKNRMRTFYECPIERVKFSEVSK